LYQDSLLFAILLLIATAVSTSTSIALWKRRSVRGAGGLFAFSAGSSIWSLTYALYWLSVSAEARLFWLNMTYFGVVIVPIAFLWFVLAYTHRDRWLNQQTLFWLIIEPAITLILLWTDPFHGLFFAGKRTPESSAFFDGGPWFWIHIIYTYGLTFFIYGLLVQAYRRAERPYRQQIRTLLIGVTIPIIGNIVSLLDLNPLRQIDLTPITFILTGLVMTYALLYEYLFDLVPVARNTVVEIMRDPVFVMDEQRRLVDINPMGKQLLAEITGQPNTVFVGQLMNTLFPALREWHSTDTGHREIEIQVGSQLRYFDWDLSVLIDQRGNHQGSVIVLRDITRRKKMQERELEVKLEKERIRVLTQFVQNASHEFKTPLTAIMSDAYLMARLDEPEKRLLKADQIKAHVFRTTRLVDLLMKLVRLETSLPQPELFDVSALLCAVYDEAAAKTRNRHFHSAVQTGLKSIIGYPDALHDALLELFDNAVRYTTPEGHITLRAGRVDEHLVIEVQDDGIGIPEALIPNIFETYWRKDAAHTTPGLGLGLAVVRKTAEVHHGRIEVESTVGQGSRFRLILPVNAV